MTKLSTESDLPKTQMLKHSANGFSFIIISKASALSGKCWKQTKEYEPRNGKQKKR